MPRNRRLLSLTTSMVGISAALAAAQIPASAQGNATASRPWTVYAIGGSGAIAPFQVGTASPLSPFPERPLRSTPRSSVSSRDGKTLYVTSLSGPNAFVTPYNTGTGRAGGPILVGPSLFSGPLIISPDGSTLYVTTFTDSGSSIIAVSTHDRTTRNVVTDIHAVLLSLAMSPDGKTLYAGAGAETPGIVALDAVTGDYITGFTDYSVPVALSVTADGQTLWAKTFDLLRTGNDFLTPISLATGDVGTPIPIGPGPAENSIFFGSQDLVITPDGKKAYVGVDGNGTVIPVDLVSKTAGPPIVIDRGGRSVDALAMSPDGRTVEAADKTMTPVNVATNTKDKPVRTGNQPVALSITPDQAPDAEILAVAHPHGTPTSFDASRSRAVTGRIRTYTWQFGDGQTTVTTTPTTTHIYSQAGSYTATLTVTDTAGTSTTVVFTGQSILRNGGPSAQKSVTLNIG